MKYKLTFRKGYVDIDFTVANQKNRFLGESTKSCTELKHFYAPDTKINLWIHTKNKTILIYFFYIKFIFY